MIGSRGSRWPRDLLDSQPRALCPDRSCRLQRLASARARAATTSCEVRWSRRGVEARRARERVELSRLLDLTPPRACRRWLAVREGRASRIGEDGYRGARDTRRRSGWRAIGRALARHRWPPPQTRRREPCTPAKSRPPPTDALDGLAGERGGDHVLHPRRAPPRAGAPRPAWRPCCLFSLRRRRPDRRAGAARRRPWDRHLVGLDAVAPPPARPHPVPRPEGGGSRIARWSRDYCAV